MPSFKSDFTCLAFRQYNLKHSTPNDVSTRKLLLIERYVTLTQSQEAQKVVNRLLFYMTDTNE